MVAPLALPLAIGAGLLGQAALGSRRRGRARGLIDAIQQANVGADGIGPPSPIGSRGQLRVLEYMRQNMPEQGAAFASQLMGQAEQVNANRLRQQVLSTVAQNPAAASNLAVREGRDTFFVRDPETGGDVIVPTQGLNEAWSDNIRQLDATVGVLETISEMEELVRVLPPGAAALDIKDPRVGRLNTLQGNFIALVKDADNLGALGADVLEFAERIAPAGRNLTDVFSSREALLAALQAGGERFEKTLRKLGRETRFYQGVDPTLRTRAREVGLRRDFAREEVAGFAPLPADQSVAARGVELADRGREAALNLIDEGVTRAETAVESGNPLDLLRAPAGAQPQQQAPGDGQAAQLINSLIGDEVARNAGVVVDAGGQLLQGDVVGAGATVLSNSAPGRFAGTVLELLQRVQEGVPGSLEELVAYLNERGQALPGGVDTRQQ